MSLAIRRLPIPPVALCVSTKKAVFYKWKIVLEHHRHSIALLACRILIKNRHVEEIDLFMQLRATWLENPQHEFARLKRIGIFDASIRRRLAKIEDFYMTRADLDRLANRLKRNKKMTPSLEKEIAFDKRYFFSTSAKSRYKKYLDIEDLSTVCDSPELMVLGHALQIKRIYSPTHNVFTHGANRAWSIPKRLIKFLLQLTYPMMPSIPFEYFRLPSSIRFKSAAEYLIKTNQKTAFMFDHVNRFDLLSMDAFFFHDQSSESALPFFLKNRSIMQLKGHLLDSCKSILHSFGIKTSGIEIAIEELSKMYEKMSSENCFGGDFYVLCFPKNAMELVYRSHRGGLPCECAASSHPRLLQELQGTSSKIKQTYYGLNATCEPQYRFLVSQGRPEMGIRIHRLSPLPSAREQFYDDWMMRLAYRVFHFPKAEKSA